MTRNRRNICILGGNDGIAKSFYSYCKKKFNKTIYINFSNKKIIKYSDKNIYNLRLYELKKCLDILGRNYIDDIVLIGKISRPDLSKFKLDGVIDQYLDKLMKAYKRGDGQILKVVISIFSENGFKIVPITNITSDFSFDNKSSDKIFNKNRFDYDDINKAKKILNDLSKYDNAQSIVIDNGFILAIEAAEGTDEMLDRVYKHKKKMNLLKNSTGILVKLPKRNQTLMADMPVIGPKTIRLIKKSKINSVAVSQNNTLVNDLNKTLMEIDKNKINLYLI